MLADTAELRTNMAQAVDIVEGMSTSMLANITVGNLLSDGFEKLGQMGLVAITAIAEAIPDLVTHTIDLGNSLFEMSMKTGASVENLSALRYVASQTGMDFDSLTTSFFKVETALGSTGPKADKLSASLEAVGLDMQTLKNSSPDEAFIAIVRALENVGNAADRDALAMQLFGRGAKEMAGLFHEDIDAMLQDAQDLGLVMSTADAAAAHAADVGWKSFSLQIEAVAMKVASVVLPALVALEQLASQAFQTLVSQYQQAAGAFSQTQIRDAIVNIGEGFIQGIAAAAGFAQGTVEGLQNVTAFALRTGEAIINIGAALIKVATLNTVDPAGKTFLDQTWQALQKVYDGIQALKAPLQSAGDIAATTFGKIEGLADSMVGKFGAAYDKASATIADFADKSKSAGETVASSIVDKLSPAMKAFEKSVEDVDSAGVGWQGTLDTIDGSVVENMRALNAAGVAVKTLEIYYGLTAAQGQAFTDMLKTETQTLKLETAQIAETEKLWDGYYKVVNAASHDSVGARVNDAWLAADAQIAALEKAKTITIEDYGIIWATAAQTADNIIQKSLESDVTTRDHYQLLMDKAEEAYDFALAHASSYTDKGLGKLHEAMLKAMQDLRDWKDLADQGITQAIGDVQNLAGEWLKAADAKKAFDAPIKNDVTAMNLQKALSDTYLGLHAVGGQLFDNGNLGGDYQQATDLASKGYSFQEIVNFLEGGILARVPIGPRIPGFIDGGPTREGLAYLHNNEYVVPAGGALVRGGGGSTITVHTTLNGVMTSDKATLQALIDKTVVDAVKSVTKFRSV